jgi:hypothetical protein
MIGGQMFFSLLVLDSLHRLGVHLSEEGAAAYFYAWRVVGAMPGVDQDAVPGALPEARQFLDLYMTRHMGPSTEGAHLTPQLIDLYEDVVPGTLFDPVASALIRYLVGGTCADWLQVPCTPGTPRAGGPPPPGRPGVDRGPLTDGRLGPGPPGHRTAVLELSSLTRGRVMYYAIPEQLKEEYGVARGPAGTGRWTPPPATVSRPPQRRGAGRRRPPQAHRPAHTNHVFPGNGAAHPCRTAPHAGRTRRRPRHRPAGEPHRHGHRRRRAVPPGRHPVPGRTSSGSD